MEGKGLQKLIVCVLILGLVVEQIQVEGLFCCQSGTAYACARLCGCGEFTGSTCPRVPSSEKAIASDYCKLGCNHACNTINSDVGSDAVERCNNACSHFCTKGVQIAMATA